MRLGCDNGHEAVTWVWAARCWYCGEPGQPEHEVMRRHRTGYQFHAPTEPPPDAA